jgi:hypothetical protein
MFLDLKVVEFCEKLVFKTLLNDKKNTNWLNALLLLRPPTGGL